jgi:chitin disaccharide deacetylase
MKTSLLGVGVLMGLSAGFVWGEDQKPEGAAAATEPVVLSSVKLGWPADARLLMIHADDLGMCHAANEAGKQAFTDGRISSGSIMMPCPWAYDFCMWAKDHPQYDIGIHVTLTAEWKTYRWRPVSAPQDVPSLCDKDGFLWDDVLQVALRAKPEEVEREIRAQVQRALAWGVKPTHLDTHMGTVFARPDFAMAYMKVGREFGITPFLVEPNPEFIAIAREHTVPLTPKIIEALKAYTSAKLDRFDYPKTDGKKSYEERRTEFLGQLSKIKPGITKFIIHPSVLTPELLSITGSARTRAWEFKVVDDPVLRQFLKDQKIELVGWKDLTRRCPMPPPTDTQPVAK